MPITCFFKDGRLYKIEPPNASTWYDVQYIVSDGKRYNINSIVELKCIEVPCFKFCDTMSGYGVTGNLDYILRMKAGIFYRRGEKELCSACLWKSTELMFANMDDWLDIKPFYRIVQYHIEMGMFDEADKAERYIINNIKQNKSYQTFISTYPPSKEYLKELNDFYIKNKRRREYYEIYYKIPEIAPKSFSAYSKMKNLNSKTYQEIKQTALQYGINIS